MIKQENIMFKAIIYAVILISAASIQGLEAAGETHATFNYDIFAEGKDVGDMRVQIIKKPLGGYQILESKSIQKSSDWDEINLKSTVNELYSLEHNLISADKKIFDQTKAYWSKVDSSGADLWMSFSEIKNPTEKVESEIVGFSIAVLDNFIPEASEVLGLSQLLFSDTKAVPTSIRLPKNSHHTTLANLPKYWSIHRQTLPAEIRLLDIETISITQMKTEYHGLKVKTLGGNEVSTHHYTLTSESRSPLNIWLAVNKNHTPYIFELQLDNNGIFTIKRKHNE
ncbi:MAG: hypothetical protein ACI936_000815 [Paraglaciecola sp.]|jgi:hypothetical protein